MASQQSSLGELSIGSSHPLQLHLPGTSNNISRNTVNVQFLNSNANIGVPIRIPSSTNSSGSPLQLSNSNLTIPLQISSTNSSNMHGQKPLINTNPTSKLINNLPLQLSNIRGQSGMTNPIIQLQMVGSQNTNLVDKPSDCSVDVQKLNQIGTRIIPTQAQTQDQSSSTTLQNKIQDPISPNTLPLVTSQLQIVTNTNSGSSVQITSSNSCPTRPQPRGLYYLQTPSGFKQTSSSETTVNNSSTVPPIIVRKPPTTSNLQFYSPVISKSSAPTKSVSTTKCAPIAPKVPQSLVIHKTSKMTPNLVPVSIGASKNAISFISSVKKTGTLLSSQESQPVFVPASHISVPTTTNQKILLTPFTPKLTNNKIVFPVGVNSNISSKTQPYNFKISNGQIQNEQQGNPTIMGPLSNIPPLQPFSKNPTATSNSVTVTTSSHQNNYSVENPFISTISGTRVEPISEKEYSISIPETDVMISDDAYTVSITDGNDVNNSVEKSFTIPIPEKGKSLICKNSPAIVDSVSHNENANNLASVPAILRRSNSDSNDKKGNNIKRRISLCGGDMTKSETSKSKYSDTLCRLLEKSKCGNDQSRVPSLFCDEELDSELEIRNKELFSNESSFKNNFSLISNNINTNKDRRKCRMSVEVNSFHEPTYDIGGNLNKQEKRSSNILNKQYKDKCVLDYMFDDAPGLQWNGTYANLNGSNLQFHLNEFGIIDLVDGNTGKDLNKCNFEFNGRDKKSSSPDEFYSCDECGCHGMAAEFITPNFCSLLCKSRFEKTTKLKKDKQVAELKKKRKNKKINIQKKKEQVDYSSSYKETNVFDSIKNDKMIPTEKHNNIDDYVLKNISEEITVQVKNPWLCSQSGFSWMKYLDYCKAIAAPEKYFKDMNPPKNNFKIAMKLEAIDPVHPSIFAVVTVVKIQGNRIRLHFDGFHDDFDFWVNCDSCDIFPPGWCEKNKRAFKPPAGFDEKSFSWNTYLKQSKAIPAPKTLFPHLTETTCLNGFRVGMKLEAEDRKNSLICVASVADVINNRILIHFDSWDDIYDYWVDPTSSYIHPVGWCDENGYSLTPPNSYKDPEGFIWDDYLTKTKSTSVPARSFKPRLPHKFKMGMKIEAVDKRVPFLIRVATVSDIRTHEIRISFDGWPDELSYWVDEDSPEVHYVGWCLKTGHSLEPPLTKEELSVPGECGTPGCRGLGNKLSSTLNLHSIPSECPYRLPISSPLQKDRLEGIRSPPEHSEPRTKEPRKNNSLLKPRDDSSSSDRLEIKLDHDDMNEDTMKSNDIDTLDFISDQNSEINVLLERSPKRKRDDEPKTTVTIYNDDRNHSKKKRDSSPITREKVETSVYEPGYMPNPNRMKPPFWGGDCLALKKILQKESFKVDPRNWSVSDVQRFVEQVTKSRDYLWMFSKHRIDGESFLMLAQDDLVNILRIKLGPAMKIYNSIIHLREKVLS